MCRGLFRLQWSHEDISEKLQITLFINSRKELTEDIGLAVVGVEEGSDSFTDGSKLGYVEGKLDGNTDSVRDGVSLRSKDGLEDDNILGSAEGIPGLAMGEGKSLGCFDKSLKPLSP